MKKTGFGQSLAKHIEAAISRELIGKKSPTVSDLMFMKSSNDDCKDGGEGGTEVNSDAAAMPSSGLKTPKSGLNLMSLLDKVVEESLRQVPPGQKPPKPNMKFMVTFSDDEDSDDVKSTPTQSDRRGSSELSPTQVSEGSSEVTSSEHAPETSSNEAYNNSILAQSFSPDSGDDCER